MSEGIEVKRRFSGVTSCGCAIAALIGHSAKGWSVTWLADGSYHHDTSFNGTVHYATEDDAVASLETVGEDFIWVELSD